MALLAASVVALAVVAALLLPFAMHNDSDISDTALRKLATSTDCDGKPNDVLVLTRDELAAFDGSNESRPLLLVILGEVFDVCSGKRFYGKNLSATIGVDPLGYNIFVGRDSSRAFVSGNFVTPVEDVREELPTAILGIVEWRSFYRKHKEYRRVGVVNGLYYDCQGRATAALLEVERAAVEGSAAKQNEADLLAKFPSCNSRYVPAEKSVTISCPLPSASNEVIRVPRKLFWVPQQGGGGSRGAASQPEESQRCACLSKEDEDAVRSASTTMRFEAYPGCTFTTPGESCRMTVAG